MKNRIGTHRVGAAEIFVLFLLTAGQLICGPYGWWLRKATFAVGCLAVIIYYCAEYGVRRSLHSFAAGTRAADWVLPAALILSTALSPWRELALDVSAPEECAVTWLFYLAALAVLRRTYRPKRWHFYLFLLGGVAVVIFEVINCVYVLSVFGNRYNVSTYSNLNTLGQALAVYGTVCTGLMFDETVRWRRAALLAVEAVLVLGITLSRSDGALLGLCAALVVLPFVRRVDGRVLGTLTWTLAAASTALAITQLLCRYAPLGGVWHVTSLLMHLANDTPLWVLIGCAPLFAACGVLLRRRRLPWLGTAAKIIAATAVCAAAALFAAVNIWRLPTGAWAPYLQFGDHWGTGRGGLWKDGIRSYLFDFSVRQKLFGTGFNTFRTYLFAKGEPIAYTTEATFYPHNVLLQMLFETGLLGLVGYLLTVLRPPGRAVRRGGGAAVLGVTAGAAYLGCMMVNVSTPETTPLLIVFLAVCGAEREEKT